MKSKKALWSGAKVGGLIITQVSKIRIYGSLYRVVTSRARVRNSIDGGIFLKRLRGWKVLLDYPHTSRLYMIRAVNEGVSIMEGRSSIHSQDLPATTQTHT